LRSAVVGVRIAVASVYANVAGRDAPVASAVAVDSVVAVDSAFGDVIVAVGVLGSQLLLWSLLLLVSPLLLAVVNIPFYWCFHRFWGLAVVGVP
jgi:hypothetical protein